MFEIPFPTPFPPPSPPALPLPSLPPSQPLPSQLKRLGGLKVIGGGGGGEADFEVAFPAPMCFLLVSYLFLIGLATFPILAQKINLDLIRGGFIVR